ncbi:MAG: HPr family phosphocarrier protein [Ruminococcus sp.]|nr:HPr family phosphocarrier protein [Ruminococcus sp.]
MKTFDYTITDEVGIHARPAGLLVKEVKTCDSTVTVAKDGKKADAKKLMALMGLGVKKGETVTVTIEGGNEDASFEKMVTFFKNNL